MPTGIKALVVVLFIGIAVFRMAEPTCLRHMGKAAFHRRRNVWFALTILAFLSPSIWLYAAVALPIMFLAARRDDNPLSLYALLMFVIPNASVDLPTVGGIGQLFGLNHYRMLSIVVLVPMLFRPRGPLDRPSALTLLDWIVLGYCLLQIALFVPYESTTNTLRRSLLLFLDTFVVFYCFAHIRPTREAVVEVIVSFALAFALLAGLAVFESLRGWLLYETIPAAWGSADQLGYLQRGESLRAQVTTGHSLSLGYVMCLGIGFWLFIQAQQPRSLLNRLVMLLFWLGLLVSYSRGAWLSGALLFAIYTALRPGAAGLLVKVLPVLAAAGVVIYLSPLKEALIDRLPFVGTADQDTVDYRRQLFEVSWQLIKINPVFGDPFVTNNMEQLRQGQGIIDIINAYVAVTLFTGFVGLALFVSVFLLSLGRCYSSMRTWLQSDPQTALIGVSLMACMLASLFFMATAGVGTIEYVLAGLLTSYAAIDVKQTATSRPSLPPQPVAFRQASS